MKWRPCLDYGQAAVLAWVRHAPECTIAHSKVRNEQLRVRNKEVSISACNSTLSVRLLAVQPFDGGT